MSRVLFATVPQAGHVNPGLPIARTLVERGHEVMWYTGQSFRAAIEATGARFAPIENAVDPGDTKLDVLLPERAKLVGLAGFKFDLKYFFLDNLPGQIADLQHILQSYTADVVLGDTGFFGAGMLHELGGPRWATYGITGLALNSRDTMPFGTGLPPSATALGRVRNRLATTLFERVLFHDVQRHFQQTRQLLGLTRATTSFLRAMLSPFLYLHGATPAFEYPRSDLAPQVHFIGPLLPASPSHFVPPAWWPELHSGKTVVLVNQGTVATTLDDLIVPTLHALADEDVLVIATTGGAPVESLGALPANARVTPFIPFGALLPHVDVMITNGGYGGVQFALANGVPLIVAGTTEDKPEIARAWPGAVPVSILKQRPRL
ncbi:glycosyl transferase [Candidatus Gracilibacteria bacterium]|nr:glycosyl transferase [Candidatus Gracilibacteria bacterium]